MTCPLPTIAYYLIRSRLLLVTLILVIESAKVSDSVTMNESNLSHVMTTIRTGVGRGRNGGVGEPVTQWRLFNECSQSFLQSFLHTVNALGRHEDVCLTHFVVWMRHTDGTIALQNGQTRRFVCLNKRLRPTTSSNGSSIKCRFHEHMNRSGYTLLESAWYPGVLLGFGRSGHSVSSLNHAKKRRCFLFNKLESSLPKPNELAIDCTTSLLQVKDSTKSARYAVDPGLLMNVFLKAL